MTCKLGWGDTEFYGSDATSIFLTAVWVSWGWMLGRSSSGFVCILQSLGFLSPMNAASDLEVVQKPPGQLIDALCVVEQSDSPSNSLRPLGSLLSLGGFVDEWTLLDLGVFFQLPWCLWDTGTDHSKLWSLSAWELGALLREALLFPSPDGFLSALCITPGAIRGD